MREGGARRRTDSCVGCCGHTRASKRVPANGRAPIRPFDVLIGGTLQLSGRVRESRRGWTGPCPTSCFYLLWTSVAPTTSTRLSASSPTPATGLFIWYGILSRTLQLLELIGRDWRLLFKQGTEQLIPILIGASKTTNQMGRGGGTLEFSLKASASRGHDGITTSALTINLLLITC